jgi:hypothetical protein
VRLSLEVVTHAWRFLSYRLRVATKAATAWGKATVVEEITVPQRAGAKRFASVVQLLEDGKGERLVRFAYTTAGTARRGPVTFRATDLEKLRAALEKCPGLTRALGLDEAGAAGKSL